jgi:proteic killer suppression protein
MDSLLKPTETTNHGFQLKPDLPGYRLHQLKGALKGYWSVTVKTNWRIIFRFEGGNARDVELTGYH